MERYLKNLTLPGAFCNTTSLFHAISQPTDDYGLLYLLTVLLLEAEKERGEAGPPIKTNHRRGSAVNQKPGCSFHIWHLPGSAQDSELPRGCSPATRHCCGPRSPPCSHRSPAASSGGNTASTLRSGCGFGRLSLFIPIYLFPQTCRYLIMPEVFIPLSNLA